MRFHVLRFFTDMLSNSFGFFETYVSELTSRFRARHWPELNRRLMTSIHQCQNLHAPELCAACGDSGAFK
jgi:hypothetical protein